jgi:hypothetical protein
MLTLPEPIQPKKCITALKALYLLLFIAATFAYDCPAVFGQPTTIRSGQLWPDVGGNHINAHCGHIIQFGKLYYWYGENRIGDRAQITCYSSPDLKTWVFRNTVLKNLGGEKGFTERPKVIYNEKTKKFVMWMHKEGGGRDYSEARAAVAVCDQPDGDFNYLGSFRPNNNMSRDDYLFKDDDGKAYFISASNGNADEKLYQLTDDYLKIDHEVATLFKGQYREAPVIFKRNGLYYLLTSFCTGAKPNPQYYATAKSITGPWSANKLITAPRTWNTYYSQGACAFVVQGTKATTYIYNLDRWVKPMRHVWLPLQFDKTGAIKPLEWYDNWTLDPVTGVATVPAAPRPLNDNPAKGKPVTASYDQPGEMFDYGHMANHTPAMAVDGKPETAWAANDNLGHWVQVDLKKIRNISAFGITFWKPGLHHFKIDVSANGSQWRTVREKTMTTMGDSNHEKLPQKNVRYVRLWYLGSEKGYNWTGISELAVFADGINIAKDCPATADDYQYPTVAANVNDGNFRSAWVINNEVLPQSVTIDLTRPANFAGVRILWEAAGVAHQYKIEASPDQQTWTMLADQTGNLEPRSLSVHYYPAKSKRYIRVTLTGFDNMGVSEPRSNMRPWPGIREIELIKNTK